MRKLNLRLLALLLVAGLVCGVGVHLLHGYQMRQNAKMFLREADRAKAEGNRPEAIRQLRNYLDFAPDDVESLAELALLLNEISKEQPAALKSAYETLEKTLRLDPGRVALRRQLVRVAIDLGRYTDAREHLVRHLLPASPKDPDLLVLLGRCQEGMGSHEKAAASYRTVIGLAPSRLEASLHLADLLQYRLGRPREADAVMEKMATANGGSSEARLAFGRYLLEQWKKRSKEDPALLQRAAAEASTALRLAPESGDALYLCAQCAVEGRRYAEARRYGDQLVSRYPGAGRVYSLLADVEVRTQRRGEAIDWLRKGIQAAPNERGLAWRLTNLLLDDGKIEEAEELTRQLREGRYDPPLVAFLNARLDYARQHWLEASRKLEKLRPDVTARPQVAKQVDFWLAGCHRQLGNPERQLTAYRRALDIDPSWLPARAGAASALVALGRIEEARDEYRVLSRMAGYPAGGILEIAHLEVLTNLTANRAKRNWAEAERLLALAEKTVPDHPSIPILRAEILVGQDRTSEAQQYLLEARARKPDEPAIHVALASLADRDRNPDRAEEYLEDAKRQCGDRVELRLARARHLLQRQGMAAADAIRGLADGADAFTTAERTELWLGLADLAIQAGDHEQARRLYRQASEANPHNLQVRLPLLDLALRTGDDSRLDSVLEEIRAIEGEGPFWHYGMALRMGLQEPADPTLLDAALGHLAECRSARSGWPRVPLLAAELHLRQGNEALAIDDYRRAMDLGDRSPWTVRRLVQLLADRRQYLEADRVLRQMDQRQTPFSAELSRAASEVSLRLDDFDRSLELARQAAHDSKNYRDSLWLGRVLDILARRARVEKRSADADRMEAEAETALWQAVALADRAPDAWIALIQFLARTNQASEAKETLAQARGKIPAAQAPSALAPCYEAMDNREAAEKEYLAAVSAAPGDARIVRQLVQFYLRIGKKAEAEPHLREIAAGRPSAGESDRVWARRALALILHEGGNYKSLLEALELVETNLRRPDADIQDLRLKSLLLASHPKRRERDRAIAILEKAVQDPQSSTAEDRFILANLYLSAAPAQWGKAARHFRALLGAAPDEPRYVGTYAAELLAHGEIEEAESRIGWLEQIAPGEFTTIALRARALCRQGAVERAIAAIQQYLEAPAGDAVDHPTRVRQVAVLLEDLSRRLAPSEQPSAQRLAGEAEKAYRQYAGLAPEGPLVLAGFFARQHRADEALDLVEQSLAHADPDLLASTMNLLLTRDNPASDYGQRFETTLQAALDRHGRPVGILLVLGDYYSLNERCREAESIYREVFQKSPGQILALNNLAVILAIQGKNLDEAERMMDKAIGRAGPTVNLLDSRALVYLVHGKLREALADAEAVMADAPTAAAHYRRAQVLAALDRPTEARRALETARKQGMKAELLHPLEVAAYAQLCKAVR